MSQKTKVRNLLHAYIDSIVDAGLTDPDPKPVCPQCGQERISE